MTRRFRCTIAYDGADFAGWQVQPGLVSVQSELERALRLVTGGEAIATFCSGRTDAGVHARGQEIHFDTQTSAYSCAKMHEALNGVLRDDVRVMAVNEVHPEWHARIDAVGKEYRYFLFHGDTMPPDLRRTCLLERRPLDHARINQAVQLLLGTHDFLSFSANRKMVEENTVRTLYRIALHRQDDRLVFRVIGNGFLYRMVRQLVGALLRVGRGECSLAEVQGMLDQPRRTHESPSAPPHALFLWRVFYDDLALQAAIHEELPPC